jgi:hypothetical protein
LADLQEDSKKMISSAFHRFELLDSVFTEFVATNDYRGEHYSFSELLNISGKLIRFYHRSVPYIATIFTIHSHDADWLNIKLCNDGFVYSQTQGTTSAGWIALSENMPYISGIISTVEPFYQCARSVYSHTQQRFDIKLYPRDDASSDIPHVLITFEPGYPDRDDSVPAHTIK